MRLLLDSGITCADRGTGIADAEAGYASRRNAGDFGNGGNKDVTQLLPLMLVPLLVWVAVWVYLMSLGSKVKRLERELVRREEEDGRR